MILSSEPEKVTTRLLYYEDAYIKQFEAKIIRVIRMDNTVGLVLDQTAFYPVGGGQPADKGVVRGENWKANVVDVQLREGNPLHVLGDVEGEIKENDNVLGILDWERRSALMRNHTAAHLISEAICQALGKPLAVVGSAVNVDKSRLDLAYEGSLRDLFPKIETIANKIVKENRPVVVSVMSRNEAEEYLNRFHESLKTLPATVQRVRIVEIKDWHVCACGGTHVRHTGELGAIRVLGRAAKGKGVERIEFVAQSP
ncbi:MAG: alanyl-tRNA editing protein [Candidatus Bathyarchaeia archaeon]